MTPCSVISCNKNGRLCQIKRRSPFVSCNWTVDFQGERPREYKHTYALFSHEKRNVSKSSVATGTWGACTWPAFSGYCHSSLLCKKCYVCLCVYHTDWSCHSHPLLCFRITVSPGKRHGWFPPMSGVICSGAHHGYLRFIVFGKEQWAGEGMGRHKLFLPSIHVPFIPVLFPQTHSFLHWTFILWDFSIGVLKWYESLSDFMYLVCGCVWRSEDNLGWCSLSTVCLVFWDWVSHWSGTFQVYPVLSKDAAASVSPIVLGVQAQATTPADFVFLFVSGSVLFLAWVLGSSSGSSVSLSDLLTLLPACLDCCLEHGT